MSWGFGDAPPMSDLSWALLADVIPLLGIERACYVWISRAPESFRRWCERPAVARWGGPVAIVRLLFVAFKLLQVAVFLGWCLILGGPTLPPMHTLPWAVGLATLLAGQILSTLVFYRLGTVGTFFGDRLGYRVRWCRAFPFSVFSHPQYVGAVLSIWGFFLVARFPNPDWVLVPAVETLLYVAGALLEEEPARRSAETG